MQKIAIPNLELSIKKYWSHMHNIEAIERRLWNAAEQLRGNGEFASDEGFPAL
mgnify:CR=1 FL=1